MHLSSRLGLRVPDGTGDSPDVPLWLDRLAEDVESRFSVGLAANRPAAGYPGAHYYATDEQTLYVDIGASWVVAAGQIDPGTIVNEMLATGAVNDRVLAALSVTTAKLADGAVTTAKLGAKAVTSDKIADALKPSAGAGNGVEALRSIGSNPGQVVAGNDPRLSDARTPTAHAASHGPGGTDRLYDGGTRSPGNANGSGYFTEVVSHSLGVVPRAVTVSCWGAPTAEWTAGVHSLTASTFTVEILTGVGGYPVLYAWTAVR